ncbi:MAG TPA: DEAD/DEAH box helicase [Peptococcaceae bacterium]|nr:DEAD/DEAH box helicase [Peptococcaceae bacterium]
MDNPIVVLSIVAPKATENEWHFAALRIEKGHIPRYLLISKVGEWLSFEDRERELQRVNNFITNCTVFVAGRDINIYCSKLFGKELEYYELVDINEILTVFHPLLGKYNLHDLKDLDSTQGKRCCSPAYRHVRQIWQFLKDCFAKGLDFEVGYLNELAKYIKGLSWEHFITDLRKEIIKKFPDRPIKTGLGLKVEDFNLFREDPQIRPEQEHIPESADWVIQCFKKGGLLSQSLTGYEDRAVQASMAQAILKGFYESRCVIIEAGTGTGKTLAYLIPALWWARKNKSRVVIATHTITLQEQLYFKEIPFLQRILPFNIKSTLLKGKGNYLCLQSFFQDNAEDELSKNDQLVRAGIFIWLGETESGDFSEISHLQNLSSIWKRYGADNPYCQPSNCQFAKICYLLKAKKKAEEADLIVINHSLLLADIKTNNRILPEYGDLIIDEAHNLYQTALQQLGFSLSGEQILKITERISGKKGSIYHALQKNRLFWAEAYPYLDWSDFFNYLEKIPALSLKVREQANELFDTCRQILQARFHIRIDRSKLGEEVFAYFLIAIENFLNRLTELNEALGKLNAILTDESEQLDSIRAEILRNKIDLDLISEGLHVIRDEGQENRVTYLEWNNAVYLKNTVIDIAPILKEGIFSRINSTVFTSATLTVADSFAYFARDMGLDNYLSLKLASPFDYHQQMLFSVVHGFQFQRVPEEDLALETAQFIQQIAEVMKGRTLVLFTSHRYLRLVYGYLQQELATLDFNILAQGINGTRETLLKEFTTNKRSILLGTSSFWEGIDIPGETLRCVIMTKLPFWPPDSPVLEAKALYLSNQGYDPFQDLHLPEAIIRFKQGFGRLIRTKEDKGVVILLDDRITYKYYGKYFLRSLPINTYFQGSAEQVLEQVSYWV